MSHFSLYFQSWDDLRKIKRTVHYGIIGVFGLSENLYAVSITFNYLFIDMIIYSAIAYAVYISIFPLLNVLVMILLNSTEHVDIFPY